MIVHSLAVVWQILASVTGVYLFTAAAVLFASAGRPVLPARERPDEPDVTEIP